MVNKTFMKTPGQSLTVSTRELGYFLKCPMRYSLSRNPGPYDYTSTNEKVLEQCFNYIVVKQIAAVALDFHTVRSHLENLVKSEIPQELQETYFESNLKIVTDFWNSLDKFKEKNTFIYPPFEMELTMHSVNLKILINAGIKTTTKSSPVPITRYLVFDFSNNVNDTWNTYSRLWAATAKRLLVEQGISTIETGVLHIKSGKFLPIKYSKHTKIDAVIADACLAYATNMEYPVFGGHCYSCLHKESCAMANSY
jgi:hypothetical protein